MSTPGGTSINTTGLGTDIASIWSFIQGLEGSANTNAAANVALAYPQQGAVTGAVTSLEQFLANPMSFLGTPQVQSQIQQGVQSASNMAGAGGMGNSGNRLAALQSTGQNIAMSDENAYVNQLLGTASLGNPVAAAAMQAAGQANQATNMGGGIAGIANIVSQLLGLGGSSSSGGGIAQIINQMFGSGTDTNAPIGPADPIGSGGGGNQTYSGPITPIDTGPNLDLNVGDPGFDWNTFFTD